MLRTKIITRTTTTEVQLLEALPNDFYGHVTFDLDRPNIQVCIIHHWTYVNPTTVYENLGIKLRGYLPVFLFEVKLKRRAVT
jgi:hypothetical protein